MSVYRKGKAGDSKTVVDIDGKLKLVELMRKKQSVLSSRISGATRWRALLNIQNQPRPGKQQVELGRGQFDLVVAHRGLGQVLLSLDDVEGAIRHLQRAVDLGAYRNSATLASLARAQQRLGDVDAAAATAERATAADEEIPVPDPVRLRVREMNLSSKECNHRAVGLIQAGRYEEALALMRIVERTLPDRPSTHYRIGLCLTRLGRIAEGLPRLERAAELAPDNEIVRRELEAARAAASGVAGDG